jgi:hypothetical protein
LYTTLRREIQVLEHVHFHGSSGALILSNTGPGYQESER